jgi:ketosteroid isomerase-like protein
MGKFLTEDYIMNIEGTIRACEDRRVQALIRADAEELDQLFHQDMLWTHSAGTMDTKGAVLSKLSSGGTKYFKIALTDTVIRPFGEVVLSTGVAVMHAEVAGTEYHLKNRYTNLWVEDNGQWKMIHWQSTGVKD